MKSSIPNILTASNLFCGCIAVMYVFLGQADMCAYFIFAALIMDFLDGFVARMLKVSSPVGKELDSLADMVGFGLVPGLILTRMLAESQGLTFPEMEISSSNLWIFSGLLVTIFSALRLAKFNLDERQSDAFYGLPTPANTILILALWLISSYWNTNWMAPPLNNSWILVGITIFSSYILVADVRLIALKFKDFGLQGNLARFILIGLSVILLASLQIPGIPLIILLYLLLSLLDNQGLFGAKE
ncbi:MAG: CDP-alcohol phosphatidyltransferase family protein [Bacteroidota bacterium]